MTEMKHAGADLTATRNLFQRLEAISAEVGYVAKNLNVDAGKGKSYKATSEVDILKAVKPLMQKHGVYSFPEKREIIERSEYTNQYGTLQRYAKMKTLYTFVNVDNPSERITVESYGEALDSGDKGLGKAMTYSDKYALMKAFMIQTGEDPDAWASPEDRPTDLLKQALKARQKLADTLREIGEDIHSEKISADIKKKAKVPSDDPAQLSNEELVRLLKAFETLQKGADQRLGKKLITDPTPTF